MKNTIITIEAPDADGFNDFMKKMVLEVSSERMIDEWIDTFKLILHFLTYGDESIKELFEDIEEE